MILGWYQKSNDIWLVPKILLFCYINLVKLEKLTLQDSLNDL